MRHDCLIAALLAWLPLSGGCAAAAAEAPPRPARRADKPRLPHCSTASSVSVVEAWQRADQGQRGKVRVRGRVNARVPCIDTLETDVLCVGDMTLDGGYDQDGTYLTLALRGDYQGVKLECTSQGRQQACPVRIGSTVIASGRLTAEPFGGYAIRVEALCQD